MKKEWIHAALLTLLCLVILNGGFTLIVWGAAQLTPEKGMGARIDGPDGQHYYANVAQKFTADKYFWPRPSAVDYNATGSGGSNKGPSNADFLKTVSDRIDSFAKHNPDVKKSDIPSEMVTASGSGLDPDISPAAAYVQVERVAKARGIEPARLQQLVAQHIDSSFTAIAPEKVNVLRLNLLLDQLK